MTGVEKGDGCAARPAVGASVVSESACLPEA